SIQILRLPHAEGLPMPAYETAGSAGMDLRAAVPEDQPMTLAPGARADVVAWDGDPLEITSAPTAVFIDGVSEPMESRQTKLRDRYLSLDESERPLAYRK
ncbi:MAG: amidohydrolase, partial [Hyphomonas sp.]